MKVRGHVGFVLIGIDDDLHCCVHDGGEVRHMGVVKQMWGATISDCRCGLISDDVQCVNCRADNLSHKHIV